MSDRNQPPLVRVYPACCTSAFCGRTSESCPACQNYPTLQDFKRWREETAAVCLDPIWCPNVYEATRNPPEPGAKE